MINRMWKIAIAGCAAFAWVFIMHPEQIAVTLNKLALVLVSASLGYWIDRVTAPYARPDKLAQAPAMPDSDVAFAAAMQRRAIIMAATMLAFAMGL